jgi:hypothetical protein
MKLEELEEKISQDRHVESTEVADYREELDVYRVNVYMSGSSPRKILDIPDELKDVRYHTNASESEHSLSGVITGRVSGTRVQIWVYHQ